MKEDIRLHRMCKKEQATKNEVISEDILKSMSIGVSKHFLDDSFTIIWGNTSFYQLLGYTEEEFLVKFSSLKDYYEQNLYHFESMKNHFLEAYHHGEKSIEYQICISANNGDPVWVIMTGILIESQDNEKSMVYILYSKINELKIKQEELSDMEKESTENFKWMMSEYAGNVYISDMDTYELLYLNKHSCNTLQASANELIGRKCYEVIQGRTSPCPFCTNSYLKKDDIYEWEFYNKKLKRTFIIKDRMLNWQGRRVRIELSYDMYSAEYKLAKKDQERESILKTIPAGMVRLDARDYLTILWCNDIFLNMIEYTKEQFAEELNNQCGYLFSEDYKRSKKLAQDLKESGDNVVFEAKIYTRSREERIWTVTLCYISGEDSWDGIPSFYSIGIDITKERKQIEKLQHISEKDALTGIYNRAETERQIKKYFEKNLNVMGALFMIDTDNFKQINDTEGHMIGDIVLTEMASGIKKIMRDSDVVGRIGGDEFTIFMKNISSVKDAEKKAEELLYMFRHLFQKEKSFLKVTCSIGIAIYPKDGTTFKEIYARADKALYQAKNMGKNNYVIYNQDYFKELEEFDCSSLGTVIDSEKQYAEYPDNLTRYIFRMLYQTDDIDQAINMILEVVGKQFDVSRVYIFENTEDGRYTSNTYEWCNEGISSQMAYLQNSNYQDYEDYEKLFEDELVFYCRDIHTLSPKLEELFSSQGIHSTLQCAYKEDRVFSGFVGFDECTGLRLWSQEEISTLSLISQIISMFLQRKKNNKLNQQIQQYQNILDNIDQCICVINKENNFLLYVNKKFKNTYSKFQIGQPYYLDSIDIHKISIIWNKKEAYLCTSTI
ncbi:Cyclic di-GMP phosphodiesterase Gmr [Clostridioides difficile]|uniref:sensor domain-containing diguanylate cyclase n=1 Tax=Clostridioides difficile TaxID=1496 RepID=UPI00097FDA6F|nr:diguanylate cyclase [Clostridioides difficile]SJO96327.1 Cyclic di-GMP phosphodiesterase Gmr [Clostridioides difficile]SJP05786.1 Cyclic di-GMP phosphodiesterase Gmr [Clostridioides difficile]SJQ70785.1 Cyclic di-GMP phosphodiesterase Gmr [Clostridioides difficile]SJR18010.1 Cyclic di-GMP phosphodiesterase Gmr [Clostridioides difficile]SJS10393.1 Cyclic di-GMP phosphodiesterase Gmr [Clostridioides difficile]